MNDDLATILSTISQQQQEILAAINSMTATGAGAVILQADAAADAAKLTKGQEELKKKWPTWPSLSPTSRLELVGWKRSSTGQPRRFYRVIGA